ncbi:MAG: hypothetical protein ACYTA5_13715 [Planctomycetota bacterium]
MRGAVPYLLSRAPDRDQVRRSSVGLGTTLITGRAVTGQEVELGTGADGAVGKVPGTEPLCPAG